MADSFDTDAMLARFRERADAAKHRDLPPVGGDERKRFLKQQQVDFMDFAIVGDADAQLVDGILTFTIDLRPAAEN